MAGALAVQQAVDEELALEGTRNQCSLLLPGLQQAKRSFQWRAAVQVAVHSCWLSHQPHGLSGSWKHECWFGLESGSGR